MDEEADVDRRFSGVERLYGMDPARSIRQSHIAVIGIGGVGSWVAEALARSGVGCLTLIDLDHVAESNINRQIHALTDTVGEAKVLAMRDRIAQIHPGCTVHCVEEFVEPGNWPDLLQTPVDALVQAAHIHRADIVALSATACQPERNFGQALLTLRSQLPGSVALWLGGSATLTRRTWPAGCWPVGALADIGPRVQAWRLGAGLG